MLSCFKIKHPTARGTWAFTYMHSPEDCAHICLHCDLLGEKWGWCTRQGCRLTLHLTEELFIASYIVRHNVGAQNQRPHISQEGRMYPGASLKCTLTAVSVSRARFPHESRCFHLLCLGSLIVSSGVTGPIPLTQFRLVAATAAGQGWGTKLCVLSSRG